MTNLSSLTDQAVWVRLRLRLLARLVAVGDRRVARLYDRLVEVELEQVGS